MSKDKLFLGVDGGASKTTAILTDNDNQIAGKGTSGSTNLHNQSREKVEYHLDVAISNALGANKLSDVNSLCLGISGIESTKNQQQFINLLKSKYSNKYKRSIILVNDDYIGLRSGSNSNHAIVTISGTGANCYGINNTDESKAGNWGFLVGDQASGFSLGQSLWKAVVKEYDHRSSETELSVAFLDEYTNNDIGELIESVYLQNDPVSYIAQATKILASPDVQRLPAIQSIVKQFINEMLLSIKTVATHLNFDKNTKFDLVLIGGVFDLEELICHKLINKASQYYPKVNIIKPENKPAFGAARVAKAYHHNKDYRLPKLHFII